MEHKIQHRRWLQVLIISLGVLAALLIFKSEYMSRLRAPQPVKQGEIETMMGLKGSSPEELKTYQTIDGVLNIQHWVTAHGVRVYFVRVPTLPMVDVELIFDAGAARNENKGGLAYMTNLLIQEGTSELSADQVAEDFDKVGAQYHAESQRDMSILKMRSLAYPEQLVPAVKNFAAILSNPAFPEKGFKREQQNALSTLKHQSQLPQYVASKALYTSLYGNQPYANWVLGDEASIKALTPEDVRQFYKKYYVAKNAVVTIVGDLSAKDADAIAQTLTNNLPEGERASKIPEVANISQKVMKKMNFPSAQTHILMGMPGLKRDDPDYYALYVGNHILGGNGSVTRIFNTIRNQHGLAYSAFS
jgi:zinc protease